MWYVGRKSRMIQLWGGDITRRIWVETRASCFQPKLAPKLAGRWMVIPQNSWNHRFWSCKEWQNYVEQLPWGHWTLRQPHWKRPTIESTELSTWQLKRSKSRPRNQVKSWSQLWQPLVSEQWVEPSDCEKTHRIRSDTPFWTETYHWSWL